MCFKTSTSSKSKSLIQYKRDNSFLFIEEKITVMNTWIETKVRNGFKTNFEVVKLISYDITKYDSRIRVISNAL